MLGPVGGTQTLPSLSPTGTGVSELGGSRGPRHPSGSTALSLGWAGSCGAW